MVWKNNIVKYNPPVRVPLNQSTTKNKEDRYYQLCKELRAIAEELSPYYDIDKVKSYSVYVWTKSNGRNENDYGENVFDIHEKEIIYYVKDHMVTSEAVPIIKRIQEQMKKIRLCMEV